MKSNLPEEIVNADDWDFITELEQKKERINQKAKTILTNKNLPVSEDKTGNKTIKRKKIETEEEWRNVIKLGWNLEDIKRRKELSNIALSTTKQYGKRNGKQNERQGYACINRQSKTYFFTTVVPANYREVTRRNWTTEASDWHQMAPQNNKQETLPSCQNRVTISNNNWKNMLGHILRLPADCPARKAMRY